MPLTPSDSIEPPPGSVVDVEDDVVKSGAGVDVGAVQETSMVFDGALESSTAVTFVGGDGGLTGSVVVVAPGI